MKRLHDRPKLHRRMHVGCIATVDGDRYGLVKSWRQEIPSCRRGFMVGLQSQDGGKKGERKKERESHKKETRKETREGEGRCWYQRRNELDTSVYGRLRGRYYDVQARARCSFLQPHPHTSLFLCFLFFFFSFSLFSFLFFFSTSTSSSFNSVHRLSHGRSILPVTWTLCGAASIKPHFYSGALHSLRSARLPPTVSRFVVA